jgi:uncharacterized protein
MTRRVPSFHEMQPAEAKALLARLHVGRIAFSFHDRVDIEPIHYVYEDDWIYGRTSPGMKLMTIRHNRWVAIEIDEVESLFEWKSVVVRGGFYVLSPDGPEHERDAWQRGVELLRRLVPGTLTEEDPVPFRTVLFRIAVQEITGRTAALCGDETDHRAAPDPDSGLLSLRAAGHP